MILLDFIAAATWLGYGPFYGIEFYGLATCGYGYSLESRQKLRLVGFYWFFVSSSIRFMLMKKGY